MEVASGGTLFLNEIGNLKLPLQAKLLSVIEQRRSSRIGSTASYPVDVRLICATNSDLYAAIDKGEFRQDLLYRINTIEIRIPPLRERGNDLFLPGRFLSATLQEEIQERPSWHFKRSTQADAALSLAGKRKGIGTCHRTCSNSFRKYTADCGRLQPPEQAITRSGLRKGKIQYRTDGKREHQRSTPHLWRQHHAGGRNVRHHKNITLQKNREI